MLEANDMVEAKLAEIREKKLYEMKRMFQAEAFGGQNPKDVKQKPGYRGRASDILGLSPYDKAREERKKREQQAEKPRDMKIDVRPKAERVKPSAKGPIGKRFDKEKKRWSDRLDKFSARHLSRHDVEGGSSTWKRSAGGKVTSAVSLAAKGGSKVVKGALNTDLARELRGIGTSNLE